MQRQEQRHLQADSRHHETAQYGESDPFASPALHLPPPDLECVSMNPPGLLERQRSNRNSESRPAQLALPNTAVPGATTATSNVASTDTHFLTQLDALQKSIPRFLTHSQRLSSLRGEVIWLRSRTTSEWQGFSRNRDFVQQSHADLSDAARALQAAIPPHSRGNSLSKAARNVLLDQERLNRKVHAAAGMETQLEKLELRLQKIEAKVDSDIKHISDLLGQTLGHQEIDPGILNETETSSTTSGVTNPDTPALVQHYLDRVADMKLERENLFDLDQQHQDEMISRQILQDQGKSPQQSDEDFEDSWLQTFAEAELAFVEATKRVKRARQYCIDEGMDPEAHRKSLAKWPQHELTGSLPAGSPVADPSPSQYSLGRREDAQTPSEHLFFFGEGRGPELLHATDPLMSPPRSLPARSSEGLQRVATWIDMVNAEPDQTEGERKDMPPIPTWDDDQPEQPLTSRLRSHINLVEQKGQHDRGQPDTRSRSVSLSEVSPRPSTVEVERPSRRRRGSKPTRQYNLSENYVSGITRPEGGVASPFVPKRVSAESTWF